MTNSEFFEIIGRTADDKVLNDDQIRKYLGIALVIPQDS